MYYKCKIHYTAETLTVKIVSFVIEDIFTAKYIAQQLEGDLYIYNDSNETWELIKSYSKEEDF